MTGILHYLNTGRMSRRAVIAGTGMSLVAPTALIAAQTPEASPVSRGGTYMADARDRLRDLLALVPAGSLRGPDPTWPLFDWVAYDAQFAALGITDPYAAASDMVTATLPLYTSDPLFIHGLTPGIRDLVGFRPFDVHQALVASTAPTQMQLYRGGIDVAAMPAFWESAGYERQSVEHGDYWTIGEEGEVDVQNPLQGTVFAAMNNVAILDDTTIAYAPTLAQLVPVMALAAGAGEAATGDADLETLIAGMPADTVSVVALPGETFLATSIVPENPGMESLTTVEELLAESDDAVGPMPRLHLSLCGVTAGVAAPEIPDDGGTPIPQGNPDAQAFMMFLAGSEEDAATAAEVAFWRLENMQSPTTGEVYRERFVPANSVDEAVEGSVMVVRFTGWPAMSGAWRNLVISRDSWPFVWLEQ